MLHQSSKTARVVIWLYAITISVMLGGSALALWRNWIDQTRSVETRLIHDARMASSMIDSSLVDALKLLEITKRDIQQIDVAHADKWQLHKLLHQSVEHFSFYNPEDPFGLLFFIDPTGRIVAQNADAKLPVVGVSDRRYFKELARNPTSKFAIGNLVTGRVSGTSIFHMAVPLVDSKGSFIGLLVQQIKTDDLAEIVKMTDAHAGAVLETFLPDGLITFTYPTAPPAELSNRLAQGKHVFSLVNGTSQASGTVIPSGGLGFSDSVIGYAKSPTFGLTTIATIPVAAMLADFLDSQKYLLLYTVCAGLVVSVLFFVFYRKSVAFDQVQTQSLHDELTGLYNRRWFDEMLPILTRQALRDQKPISVLFIDIDHFKQFNDELGHEAGDRVLFILAQFLQKSVHRPHDFVCRWGGEEFVAILPGTDENGAIHVAEKIIEGTRLLSTENFGSIKRTITVSVGLSSTMPTAEDHHVDLVAQADKAMLEAKAKGRNCLVVYRKAS